MTETRTFVDTAASVVDARHYVRRVLADAPAQVADAVEVAVSELTSNCIRHAGTAFSLTLERTPNRLRVEITDRGPGLPVLRHPRPEEPSGRGLQIVATLTDRWGILDDPDRPGKTVWFELDLT
jgi:anti-sigma regulatory factor (Ser/Thr protein kinase)